MNSALVRRLFLLAAAAFAAPPLSAQAPQTLVLGPDGMTPLTYFSLRAEADDLWARGDTAGVGQAYQRLTEAYPLDGETWWGLGYVRYVQGLYHPAIRALHRAAELGVEPAYRSMPNYLALAYARAGVPDSAISALQRARSDYRSEHFFRLLQNPAFEGIRDDPRFQAFTRPVGEGVSRVAGWRSDIDFLLDHAREVNPVYSQGSLPDTLVQAAERLKQRIPELSDAQVAIEVTHLLALLGHAHNSLLFHVSPDTHGRVKFSHLPVSFWLFPEGLHIVGSADGYEDLIGARVLRFGDTPADDALRATARLVPSESPMEVAWVGPTFLRVPEVLHHLGLSRSASEAAVTVLDRAGRTRTLRLPSVPQERQRKIEAPADGQAPPPLWLSRPDEMFWFERLPEQGVLYVQLNNLLDTRDESLDSFGLRLRAFLREHPELRTLVVDVRRNNGGDTYLYQSLLRTLIAFDALDDTRLFVLTGRGTFSAASNFVADLDRLTDAVYVGEPSAGRPLMIGGDQYMLDLPYSRLRASLSSSTWALTGPRDTRLWIAPDVPVPLTAADFFRNRDPILMAVLDLVSAQAMGEPAR